MSAGVLPVRGEKRTLCPCPSEPPAKFHRTVSPTLIVGKGWAERVADGEHIDRLVAGPRWGRRRIVAAAGGDEDGRRSTGEHA